MNNKKSNVIIIITSILYIIYFIFILLQWDLGANVLSPTVVLMATYLLIKSYFIKSDSSISRVVSLCFSLACFSWVVADTVWFIYDTILHINPETMVFIFNLYNISNIFIAIGAIVFAISLFKQWNFIQLVIDTVVISVISFILFWALFLKRNRYIFQLMTDKDILTGFIIILDAIIVIAIVLWWFSIRKGNISLSIFAIAVGILSFAIIDLGYYFVSFYSHFEPNSLLDLAYMTSLLSISFGCFINRNKNRESAKNEITKYSNIGIKNINYFLFLIILVFTFIMHFQWKEILYLFLFMLFHFIISQYIHTSSQNDLLLQIQRKMNHELEHIIQQRTEEIIKKNKELRKKNKSLKFLSNQDTLTNLYNRRYFFSNLEDEIKSAHISERIALLYIDVDRFKTINDTYGHFLGDQLLVDLSKRLKENINENAILARLGGDEFVIEYKGAFEYTDIEKNAQIIIEKCHDPFEIGEYIFQIGVSIGISIYPLDAQDKDSLIKNADIAMYEAKALGKNRCITYDTLYTNIIQRKNYIEILLKKANFDTEFELFYQPQFKIPDNTLIGMEALLRWKNPSSGYISPAEFIPIAEEIDYIIPIGEWVLKEAISQIGKWNKEYQCDFKMGINVSPKQLDNKNLIHILRNTLEVNHVKPENIDIEIVESIAIEGEYRIKQIESLFESLGVSISIDDFGTGYSSLSYLKIFPFERIKIAKPLIDTIASVKYDLEIVKATIMLAKSIAIKTIAEGVETKEQYDILVELGCDEIQGYYLGRPVPVQEFEKLYLNNL